MTQNRTGAPELRATLKTALLALCALAIPGPAADGSTYVGNPNRTINGITLTAQNPLYTASVVLGCSVELEIPDINGDPPMIQSFLGSADECLVLAPAFVPQGVYGSLDSNGASVALDLRWPVFVFDTDDLPPPGTATMVLLMGDADWTSAQSLSPTGAPVHVQHGDPEHDGLIDALKANAGLYIDGDSDGALSPAELAAGPVALPL